MIKDKSKLGSALVWGGLTVALYWLLFHYAGGFQTLAHTTLDACAVGGEYYNNATAELCAAENGTFIEGRWWYVLAPIALAFALSYTHGLFTGLFWDLVGLTAKK
ncbi:MAG TPA: hypothetical protein PKC12_02010 [Thiobacillaceae bacterium]|nr:hypothetical protein [Thiobacillaceae bacterium]